MTIVFFEGQFDSIVKWMEKKPFEGILLGKALPDVFAQDRVVGAAFVTLRAPYLLVFLSRMSSNDVMLQIFGIQAKRLTPLARIVACLKAAYRVR